MTILRDAFKHRRKLISLPLLLVVLSMTVASPIESVKGLVVDTGVVIGTFFTMDSGRIATYSGGGNIKIYDINSGSSTTFALPITGFVAPPVIFGNKVMVTISTSPNFYAPMNIYYCKLPNTVPLSPCGHWEQIGATGGLQYLFVWGFPTAVGDIAIWPSLTSGPVSNDNVSMGFQIWHFSTDRARNVTLPVSISPSGRTRGLTTNGDTIAFAAKSSTSSPSTTLQYCNLSDSANCRIIDTGVAVTWPYIGQNTVAFMDNSTSNPRIGYFDILRGQGSSPGTGPLGSLSVGSPSVYGDRIAFIASELTVGYDCNGDGTVSPSQYCLQYWNIRAPSYVATMLNPSAAPPTATYNIDVAINGNIIAFTGPTNSIQFVTVPMQGDVDQDGVVDSTDQNIVNSCLGALLKGTVC